MSEKRGVKETIEAFRGVGVLTRKGWEIRKEGLAGLPKLVEAYGPVKAGIEGAGDIDDELKDLDPQEIQLLVEALTVEFGDTLEMMGVKGMKRYLALAAKSVAAGEVAYSAFKPIIEEISAIRNEVKAQ